MTQGTSVHDHMVFMVLGQGQQVWFCCRAVQVVKFWSWVWSGVSWLRQVWESRVVGVDRFYREEQPVMKPDMEGVILTVYSR